ncbi:MAG: hypothetical protein K9J12_17435 [Melioribacteraceae bacterium]|nr:hypothetical protein [Melioribacteraceae bacterium]MCF8414226.1 hypothetical protein [Melioribacteraceae bacterium]MCF8431271.1 hypothetical protein [Melioribacteraceae bacterium]
MGEINTNTQNVWYLFHGYGQLAKYFLNNFKTFHDKHTILIAPEGLHRFYLNGFSGRVGASWMTKEERETDIRNQINYLNSLHEKISKIAPENANYHILGFSQGVATAGRWLANSELKIKSFVQYAGGFPNDIDNIKIDAKLNNVKYLICLGNEDEFINQESLRKEEKFLSDFNPNLEIIIFDGGHEIKKETLEIIKGKVK